MAAATPLLARQALAEALGSFGLVVVVIGSGIMAQDLSADVGLQLLENSLATGAGLAALILAFGPVSGAHFNPAVTLADRLLGGISTPHALVYVAAQVVGGCLGAVAANLMFGLSAVSISTKERSAPELWLSEVLATAGLVLLVVALGRSGRGDVAPFAVGAYIAGAYWWSSSTNFANPMIDVARTLSDTFAGIAPASVPMFWVAQLIGVLAAVGLARVLYPAAHHADPDPTATDTETDTDTDAVPTPTLEETS